MIARGWCNKYDIAYGPVLRYDTLIIYIYDYTGEICPIIDKTFFPNISDDILQEMKNDHKEMQRELEILKK
jgi:hypothetical protein